MTFATATVTQAEATALVVACEKLSYALREVYSGECPPSAPKRNTLAQIDTLVTAVSSAITAANAS